MKKEKKSVSKSLIAFFLSFLMVFHTLANPVVAYAASYTITFNPNGGTYNGSTANTTKTASSGSTVTFAANPTRTGYAFAGWNLSAQTIKSYADGSGASFSHTAGKWTSRDSTTSSGYTKYKGTIANNSTSDNWIKLEYPTYSIAAGETITVSGQFRLNSSPVSVVVSHFFYRNDWSGQMKTYSQSSSWQTFSFSRTSSAAQNNTAYLDITTASLAAYSSFTYDIDLSNIKIERSATKYTASSFVCYDGNMTATAQWTPNTYTVVYNANGGTGTTASSSHTYDTAKKLTSNGFSKTGYTFAGWATSSGGSAVYADGASVSNLTATNNGTVNLYAVWEKNSYTVTYNANGGTTSATAKTVPYGGTVDLSPTASRTGYTFIGWSTSSTARIPLSSYSMPAGNVTLYAVYSIKVSDVENHEYPDYTATPSKIDDEVYLLVWITASPSIYKFYPLTYSQDVNTMVYRYTLPTTDISSFVNGRAYSYQLVVYDNAGNYTVLYKGGSAGDTQPEDIVKPEYTQTVNHYKYNPISKNWILFETTTHLVVSGSSFTPSYVTAPAGYSASSKDAGKTVTSENTYNAYYRPNTYTITFNANGGTVAPATQTVTYDNYYGTLPVPNRVGYTFIGWNTAQNGTGTTVNEGDIYATAGNQTLYAQWQANVYEVKLDSQGAANPGTTEYYQKYDSGNFTTNTCNTAITKINVPVKTGYTFGGYYTDKDGAGTQYIDAAGNILSTKNTFSANATLYAKWTANIYTVKYHANGGTGRMEDTIVTYDTTAKLSSNLFERTGYTFAGWTETADGDVTYTDKQSVTNLSDTNGAAINLYAVWNINSYEVTYDYWTNGGSNAERDKANVDYQAAIDLSVSAEKRDGFTFVGWNTDASATTGLDSLTMETENVTLYAVFAKTINVTLIERDGEDTIETVFSKTIYNNTNQADFIIVESGSLSGWRNNGWSSETGALAQAVTSTGATYTTSDSIKLYALYVSDVIVSYDTNGSDIKYDCVTMERFHNASGEYSYPIFNVERAPELSDHSFVMWEAEDGTTYRADIPAEIKESTVLTAVWDQFPVIEAYDRYFTLEQAQSGFITQMELLDKVCATDREDGPLVKGVEVIVKDYNAQNFMEITEDTDIEVIYQATDDFGNVVEKKIDVRIVDTSMKKGRQYYIRFIRSDFLMNQNGVLRSKDDGGLEETSIWRTNVNYLNSLKKALSKDTADAETYFFTTEELRRIKEMSPAS